MKNEMDNELFENDKETKRDKFIRLAEARTQKAIDMIRKIGNLGNTNFYEYSKEDVEFIFGTLEKELKASKSKFNAEPEEEEVVFKLRR